MRLTVRVTPGARRGDVGGRYGTAEPPVLVVRVTAPAIEGRANEAVCRALAEAFGVPRRGIEVVAGTSGRTKVVEVPGADPDLARALLDR